MVAAAAAAHHALMRTKLGFGTALASLALGMLAPPVLWAVCGDNVIDGEERCDGTDVGGTTCADLTAGFAQSGEVRCNADCTFDATDCRRAFIESLVPGRGKNRCHLEWGTVGTSTRGASVVKRYCVDGDRTCDQDRQFNNSCSFKIQLCMDVPDDRIAGCTPTNIFRVDLLQPKPTSDATQKVVDGVLSAARNAAPAQAQIVNGSVAYNPPITGFACGAATVAVPLRGTTGKARPGKVKIKARTSDNSGRVKTVGALTLVCNP
jgi:hypothetical protein